MQRDAADLQAKLQQGRDYWLRRRALDIYNALPPS